MKVVRTSPINYCSWGADNLANYCNDGRVVGEIRWMHCTLLVIA